jgi:uncharacterized membrane protein
MVDIDNYLGAHFSPIILIFVPFYAIWASPKWLLIFQVIAVGASALPVYWYAKEKSSGSFTPLVFLFAYLAYPILGNALLYDFHEVVFAVPFAAFSFYFLEKRRNTLFIVFSSILALSQEHLVLLVLMMGLYASFIQKRWKFGILVALSSTVYFILIVFFLMPILSSTGEPALLTVHSSYGSRYAWLGSSMPEILRNILTHPIKILKNLISQERIGYLLQLIIPTFSLAVYSWPIAIILPLVLVNLLSSNAMMFNVFFYHSAVLSPFIFFSAIISFSKWFADDSFIRKLFLSSIVLISIGFNFRYSVNPLSENYQFSDYISTSHARSISEVKKIIPQGA